MKLSLQSVCQLTFLSLCCTLIAVRESDSTFVPGRCLCPHTVLGVRGQLKELTVHQKSPSCNKVAVIVTLNNNEAVCLNPEAPMGRQLIRCWNKVHEKNLDGKVCLKRRRRGRGRGKGGQRQRSRQRSRGNNTKASAQASQ
ncbi:C-X-C motif chemokine 9 isoform X1 [Lates calcarifer]|uniref:C-X-C motif chemokine 9 isoform X1 n=1 Tax=Lates calcarifer TaxID=8187 RepID=A0A4W6C6H3_LATCA|nr:C-X-C motif chemokine 9 isoform X1 [Lates calcarifer]